MPMPSLATITGGELRTHFQATCRLLAIEHFAKSHPGADRAAADAYADRNWRQFESRAIDFLALAEADRRARLSSPQN
jgi:hypothetical protein